MPEPALKIVRPAPTEIRRFELPDLDTHGAWIIPRIVQAYPHIPERGVIGWLRGILYINEYHFLYQENAVALAQAVRPYGILSDLVIWERFVWCQNHVDPKQQAAAADFYPRFAKWGRDMDAGSFVVGEHSDVPNELIEGKIGRIMERKQSFVRL